MALIDSIKKSWASVLVIGGISGGTLYAIHVLDARAEEVAQKAVDAKVNKAMIDGAKEAASKAVAEQLPSISKQVAEDTVREVLRQQKEEKKAKKPTNN